MHAPAAGRIVAEWMLTGQRPADVDPTPFALGRFAAGKTTQAGFVF
jgi:glycine/D-amino acid oxidase-like deaminating enzyme